MLELTPKGIMIIAVSVVVGSVLVWMLLPYILGSGTSATGTTTTSTRSTIPPGGVASYYPCNVCYPFPTTGYACPSNCSTAVYCLNKNQGISCVKMAGNNTVRNTT